MYNNYWNPNHNMMFQNAVPSVDPNYQYFSNHVPNVNPYDQVSMDKDRESLALDLYLYPESQPTDLGDGFFSYSWERIVNQRGLIRAAMIVPGKKVISGGVAPQGWDPFYIFESLPNSKDQWVISVHNGKGGGRRINFYVIAKS